MSNQKHETGAGTKLKRASYREAIRWVAYNDSAGCADALNPHSASELITAALVADLFGADPARVGADIVRERKRESSAGGKENG